MRDSVEREGGPATPGGLGESERQFRLLVEGVTDYAIYMLDPQGNIASWNAGGVRIKGYEADEIIGRHFSCFYTDADRATNEPARALETARRVGRYEKEGLRVRKDGSRFWANVVIDAVHDEGGRLIGFAKITRDITERMASAQALEVAQQTLLQAQKMEAVAQLTYGVAHDFNNLLTVITNSLGLIALDSGDRDRIQRLVAGAQRAAERGALLTRQLLAFSRRQTLKPERHDISALVHGIEAMLRRAVGETIELEISPANGLPAVEVDAAEFEAAMLNLVVNARDAIDGSGQVAIRVHERTLQPGQEAEAAGVVPGRYVCVSVVDDGCGMSEEVRQRAVEPFFTTKEVGKGSGLGLSQVFGFAAQSRGYVEIASAEGRGTTVSFCLPAAPDDEPLEEDAEDAPVRVLVVEDDVDLQMVAVEALRFMGYSVQTAGDGPAALEILRRDPRIGILFTDVVMPKGMSGVELAAQARALRPGLKVLLASGYARGQLPTIPAGCDFIPKPYGFEDLQQRLGALAIA